MYYVLLLCMVSVPICEASESDGYRHLQFEPEREEGLACGRLGKSILDCLSGFWSCGGKSSALPLSSDDEQSYFSAASPLLRTDAEENPLFEGGPLPSSYGYGAFIGSISSRNETLWQSLKQDDLHVAGIERAVWEGADPFDWDERPRGISEMPMLYVAERLGADDAQVSQWTGKMYTLLRAYAIRQECRVIGRDACCDKDRDAIKEVLGDFGSRQDRPAFEAHGAIWGEICAFLGIDMVSMRRLVFPLLKRDGQNDYIRERMMPSKFDSCERFALGCAISDFMHCLALTLADADVYDVHRFCVEGLITRVDCLNEQTMNSHRLNAERIRASLKPSVNEQLLDKVDLLMQWPQSLRAKI